MKTSLLWLRHLCYLSSFAILLFASTLFATSETATYNNEIYSNNDSTFLWKIAPGDDLTVTWTCNDKNPAAKSIVSSVNYIVSSDDVTCWGFHENGTQSESFKGASGDVTSYLQCNTSQAPRTDNSTSSTVTSSSISMQCFVDEKSEEHQKINLGAFSCKEYNDTSSPQCNSTLSLENDTEDGWSFPGWCDIFKPGC